MAPVGVAVVPLEFVLFGGTIVEFSVVVVVVGVVVGVDVDVDVDVVGVVVVSVDVDIVGGIVVTGVCVTYGGASVTVVSWAYTACNRKMIQTFIIVIIKTEREGCDIGMGWDGRGCGI